MSLIFFRNLIQIGIGVKNEIISFIGHNQFFVTAAVTAIVITTWGNIYFLWGCKSNEREAFVNAAKVWEVVSYALTFAYTIWFWYWPTKQKRGKYILMHLTPNKSGLVGSQIITSVLLIGGITVIHLFAFFSLDIHSKKFEIINCILGKVNGYSGFVSMFLLCATYFIFCILSRTVIKNINVTTKATKKDNLQIKGELKTGLRYIDMPTFVAFGILAIYAFILCYNGKFGQMEEFFSGSIAFDLILSNFAWAKTNTG